MSIWRNISQIEEITSKISHRRSIDVARAIALTRFLQEMETIFDDDFRIVTAHPILMINKNDGSNEPIFTVGLWVRFSVCKVEYYIEMNENPFFPALFLKNYRLDSKTVCCEYADDMNGEMYFNFGWDAEQSTITQLITNMHRLFSVVQQRNGNTYVKEIPAYSRREKQTIYT